MECIVIGNDVSKGRADIAIINQSGTLLKGSGGYDDTRKGQDDFAAKLWELHRQFPEARLIAGVEATGGYERTWVKFFRREREKGLIVAVHRLNPLAVKRFLEADLHRKVDDVRAALGIARYLLERRLKVDPDEIPLDGRVVFYRNIRGLIQQRMVLSQRFQALLSAANPELVAYCNSGVPDWLLLVCRQYPTAEALARCQVKTLAAIPHVGEAKAERLRTAAQTSTAALDGPATAAAVTLLVEEILHLDDRIDALQKRLIEMMRDDARVPLLDSIPGISPWSAVALALEIGDPERFADVRQLVAWAGLDPREDTSGDGVIKHGISHRGNAYLRALLFPLALAAMQHHPIVSDFIYRKINEGKPKKVALVAGMVKILRIAFALLVTKKPYDPNHEANRAKPNAQQRQQDRATSAEPQAPTPSSDLAAPISARERKRRRERLTQAKAEAEKAAAQPSHGCEVRPQKRDQRATANAASPPPT